LPAARDQHGAAGPQPLEHDVHFFIGPPPVKLILMMWRSACRTVQSFEDAHAAAVGPACPEQARTAENLHGGARPPVSLPCAAITPAIPVP